MNTETLIENRTQVDRALQTLLFETREIVYELVKPLAAQGKFSLNNIPIDSRGKLRTVDDIAQTMDPTALLAILMECLSERSDSDLHIPNVNFGLVDKVRNIRNDYSHGGADYNDINYVRDAVNATNDLRLGLLNARIRPDVRQRQPSPSPRMSPDIVKKSALETASSGRKAVVRSPKAASRPYGVWRRTSGGRDGGLPNAQLRPDRPHHEPGRTNFWQHVEGPTRPQPAVRKVNVRGKYGKTPLHDAAISGHAEKVKSLIRAGAEVNAKDNRGKTPLHDAAISGHAEKVKSLIRAGAEVTVKNNNGETPLHYAAGSNNVAVVQALIGAGAEVTVKNNNGETPLHGAARSSNVAVAQALIEAGAEVNAKDTNGLTPLHYAARSGRIEVAQALIGAGAEVNAKNNNGWTPLNYAATNGHAELVNLLNLEAAKLSLKGTQSAPSIFERIKGFYREATRPVICEYRGCVKRCQEDLGFCSEHRVIGEVVESISRFLDGADPKLWEFRKKFEVVVRPLGSDAGLATSERHIFVSSHVSPAAFWRVFRHEFAHIIDWNGGLGGPHGGTWTRIMKDLGCTADTVREVFPLASEPVLPECLIKVRLGRRDRWKLKIEPLPPGWRGY